MNKRIIAALTALAFATSPLSALAQGGAVKLLNLTKRVQDLLQITKLYTVFEVHDDEAKAVRSFS